MDETVLFLCGSGEYILNVFKCDGSPDCFDSSDEWTDGCNNALNAEGNHAFSKDPLTK